jgi:hypothetical protein
VSDDDEELVEERIAGYGIAFRRPDFWQTRREEGARPTYLYWDEDAGSLRITPWRETSDAFVLEQFLASTFETERERGHEPAWQTIGTHKFLTWVQDGESRSHFYMTGRDRLVIVCSYAYDPEWLEDEDTGFMIEAWLEEAQEALASMTF